MRSETTRIALDGWVAAETVVARFGGGDGAGTPGGGADGDVVWFDAGVETDHAGGVPPAGYPKRSYVGWGSRSLSASARETGSLEAAWGTLRQATAGGGDQEDDAPLGWWGWVGYGAGAHELQPGDAAWADRLGDPVHPDLSLLEVDRALIFDAASGTVELVVRGDHAAWIAELLEWWRSAEPLDEPPRPAPATAVWADSDERYLDLVDRCQEAIHRGDAFVMCLTTSVSVATTDDDLTVYRRLRRASPAPRASFLRICGVSVLSASPETFLSIDASGVATTSPIKGTRPRGRDAASDEALAHDLRSSVKERAENLMVVDLLRNDLSRVAVPGGVAVSELCVVKTYRHVHQLVSTVEAPLREGVTGVDAVRVLFPPGSMTGAPKHRVVDLLSQWEAAPRGVYSGAIGRFERSGRVELAVVIRAVVLGGDAVEGPGAQDARGPAPRTATIGVGGGVTSLSVPADELAEIRTKAAALLAVLGVS